jgi:hypothetical protein
VKRISFSILVAAAWTVPAALSATAAAQTAAQATKPPFLVVKPSGFDERTDEARAREDRLLRRMEQNDYLFRNICVHCGGGVNRVGSNAPFNPIQALGPQQRQGLEDDRPIEAEP